MKTFAMRGSTRLSCIEISSLILFLVTSVSVSARSAAKNIQERKVNLTSLCNGGIREVKAGQVSSGQIAVGQVRCWSVHLPASHYMHVDVIQNGIDVVVQLYTSAGVAVGGEI